MTSLPHSATRLSELDRYRIEIDIRNLKVVLNTEHLAARSVDLFHKERLTSLVAYNLVTQFRRQAAALIREPPRRSSDSWFPHESCGLCEGQKRLSQSERAWPQNGSFLFGGPRA